MVRRWPVRIRLTAAFTVVMAAVLAGVGVVTVAHTGESLDVAATEAVTYRLRDLQQVADAPTPVLSGVGRDSGEQVLELTGRVVAGSAGMTDRPLLGPAELAAARRGQVVVDHPAGGRLAGPVRIAAAPAAGGDRIAVAATTLAGDAAVADLRGELLVWLPLVLLAAGAGAYVLAVAALRPVERMRARAAAITAESPGQRLPVPVARDEISRLGRTFNELLDRLHAALERERRFVADASHELRTPLGLLTTELELALRRPRAPAELTAALRSALEETGRLSRLAEDLLLLARTDQVGGPCGAAEALEVRPQLESVITRYRVSLGEDVLVLDCPPGLAVRVEGDDLDRAVSNLIDNARQHGRPPITITACAGRTDQAGDTGDTSDRSGTVAIVVHDHGDGLDLVFLPHAFDRFTRADDARTGGGTGLGLAIVAALARRNGGQACAVNHAGGGAVVTLTFPAAG